jgi:ATP-dependent DNA ligase
MIAPRFWSESEAFVMETLQSIAGQGGEGLILRKPQSLYISGRSDSLVKFKVFLHSRLFFSSVSSLLVLPLIL